MLGWLRKRAEEAYAQANPFDNGKTAATVRAQRPASSPVPTRSAPRQQQPSYGSGVGGFINRTRDVFDANTPQDQFRRQQQQELWKAPMVAVAPPDTRNLLGRTFDQVNIFDNNRTFQQATPTTNKSVRQELGDMAYKYTELPRQLGDTTQAGVQGVVGLGEIAKESLFGTDQSYADKAFEVRDRLDAALKGKGTFKGGAPESFKGIDRASKGFIEDPQKAADTAAIGTDIAQYFPVAKGFKAGASVASQLPKVVLGNAIEGGVTSAAAGAAQQYAGNGTVDVGQLAKQTALGTVMSAGAPVAGKAVGNVARGAASAVPTTRLVSGAKQLAANEGGFIELGRTPKKIHPEDQNVMADFIDMQRGVYKPTQQGAYNLELDASRIAERYGLAMPNNPKGLADVFDQRLQQDGFGKLDTPDMDVEQRLSLDYMKNPNRPAPSTSLVGEGAQAPLQMPPSRKQQLMDNMRRLASDEKGAIGRNIRDEGVDPTKTLNDFNGNPIKKGDTVEVETIMGTKTAKVIGVTDGRYPEVKYKLNEDLTVGMQAPIKAGTTLKTRPELVNQAIQPPKTTFDTNLEQAGVKPKGFILKETKGRAGRKDTVRVSADPETGKMGKTYQTEFDAKSADPYIKEYADSLKQMESGLRGGDMIPDGEGGYKRISEHSKFYREHFANTGKKPTRADWYAEAERQVKSGKADKDFMEYYNAKVTDRGTAPDNARVLENKPTRRMTEKEWDSLIKQAEAEAPKSKNAVNSVTQGAKEEQLRAVSQGDYKRAQQLREQIGEVEQGLKRTPPDLSKRAEDIVPDFEAKDIKGKSNKQIKQRFMERANQYLGERRASEFRSVDEARAFNDQFSDLSDVQKLEVIRAADQPSYKSGDARVQEAVEALHTKYDKLYNYFTSDRNVQMGYQHSYYPRMYKNPSTGELIDGAQFELLQRGSARQKGRTADIVAEDFLVTKDPAEALQLYYSNLENAAAGKSFLNDLEKEGLVIRSTDPVRGMRPIVAEGMQESGTIFYAKPEVAKSLDRMFGTQEASGAFEKLVEKGQGLNSFMQSVVLSGGVPNTPVNAFGIMQVMKESMGGHPIIAGKAFYKSLSRKNTDKFFKANSDVIQEMSKNGYELRIDYNAKYRNMFQRIAETGKKDGKIAGVGEAWDQFTNDATFQRFMPALEVMHYKQLRDGMIRRGAAPEVAAKRAMDATSNFFGKTQMAKQASRSKVGQDFVGATLFAPRFRESMINFWGRNVVALNPKNLGKAEYRANQMFMVTAAATWAAMEGANKALNGNWMHDNPDGKKDKLIVPDEFVPFNTNGKDVAVPFLSSIATVPRNAAQGVFNVATGKFSEAGKNLASFASMPLRTGGELLTNQDYFGNNIVEDDATPKQKFTQAGAYIAKNNTQPWLREAGNALGQNLPDDVKKAVGIKKKSPFEAISNALETPTRFYDPKYYRYDNGWTPRGAPGDKFTITEQRERAKVKKDMDSIPSSVGLSKKQKEAYEALITVDFDDEGNLKTDNDPFYRAKRATALQDDGVFEAMKQRASYNNKLKGQPIDPLFNLPADARRVMLWKQTLPAGTKDPTIAQIYEQEWYQDFRGEQDKYYNEKQAWNKKMGYKPGPADTNPYPQAPKELQSKLDYYYTLPKGTGARSNMLRSNPDILAHWDRTEAWTNGERAMVGLGPVDSDGGFTTFASSGSKGGSRSRSGSRGGRGGSRTSKGKFDYKLDTFAPKGGNLSKQLAKLVENAGKKSKPKIKKTKNYA
jgi:hypothetical protein